MSEKQSKVYNAPTLNQVDIKDRFWRPRLDTNREVTLEHQLSKLEEAGTLDNFRIAAGEKMGVHRGMRFSDSDVYKWLEAASYTLAKHPSEKLDGQVDFLIELIQEAQEKNGYLNTYFTINDPERKWTNLGVMHELYCAGHLFQAAAAQATGAKNLLSVAIRFANHLLQTFGPSANCGYPGHEEVELGLIDLYLATGRSEYMDLAVFFVEQRGRTPSPFECELKNVTKIAGTRQMKKQYQSLLLTEKGRYDGSYAQDHCSVGEQTQVVGHAVRAMYLYSAMADIVLETGKTDLLPVLKRLWSSMTEKRMYVTGGLGSSDANEGLTIDYDLPNSQAYAETCAAIGNVMWNFRMLRLTGEGRFADVMERVLYNGFLSSISLDGTRYFYVNPLASDGSHHRQSWFDCACCPPNIARLLASLERYVYLLGDDEILINLYIAGSLNASISGHTILLSQQTDYPWNGDAAIDISVKKPVAFTLGCRIPSWCDNYTVRVNGNSADWTRSNEKGYARISRKWSDGDRVEIKLDMSIIALVSHPHVSENIGRIALQRGPLIYCLEETDNEHDLESMLLPHVPRCEAHFEPELLGGVIVLDGEAFIHNLSAWDGKLYAKAGSIPYQLSRFKAIPYYAWDNRQSGEMRVWMKSIGL